MQKNAERVQALIEAYEDAGLYDEALINEILRFRAVDQLVSSSPAINEWGISLEDLYALTKNSTEELFGEFLVDIDKMGRLYSLSFTVDALEVAHALGMYQSLKLGKEWQSFLEPILLGYAQEERKGKIVFAYTEEYMALIDPILQGFAKDQVILHTSSEEGYELLKRLYPLATIVKALPKKTCAHIVAICTDKDKKHLLKELTKLTAMLDPEGDGHFYLHPLYALKRGEKYEKGLNQFLTMPRLEKVEVELGTGVYHWHVSQENSEHLELCWHKDKEESLFITALEKDALPEMKVNLLYWYLETVVKVDTPLWGEESLYEVARFVDVDTLDILHEADWLIEPCRGSYQMGPIGEGRGVLTLEEGSVAVLFEDEEDAYVWAAFWASEEGQRLFESLAKEANSSAMLGELVGLVGHKTLPPKTKAKVAKEFKLHFKAYEESLKKIETQWSKEKEKLAKPFKK